MSAFTEVVAGTTYYIRAHAATSADAGAGSLTWGFTEADAPLELAPRTDVAVGAVGSRVRIYDRDGSLRATFAGIDLRWSAGKGVDGADVSFTVNTAEAGWDVDVLDDALGRVQIDVGDGWVPIGPPYILTSSGDVIGDGARNISVVGQCGLMLTAEWQVLPPSGVLRRRSPDVQYFGWMNNPFNDSDWDAPTRVTRASLEPAVFDEDGVKMSGDLKGGQPGPHWPAEDADWIYADGSGALTLFRIGSFTLGDATQMRIASTADEEHKVYLFGPGYGGAVIESSKQETGYTEVSKFDRVLEPGDYFVAAEMTSVASEGGDGFDALSLYVGRIGGDDRVNPADVVLSTGDSGITVLRQDKDDVRPGLTVGQILHLMKDRNQAWMTDPTASCNTVTLDFSETLDTEGDDWPDAHERSWAIGTPVSQVLADLSDVADFSMGLDKALQAWSDRGSDLSGLVALTKGSAARAVGENLISYTYNTTQPTVTRATVLTEDGYTTKVDADLEDTVPARSSYLETQQSASIGEGKALASRYITENGSVRRVFTARFTGVAGTVPGIDFDWGDIITGLTRAGGTQDVRVLSWSGEQDGSKLIFEAELEAI